MPDAPTDFEVAEEAVILFNELLATALVRVTALSEAHDLPLTDDSRADVVTGISTGLAVMADHFQANSLLDHDAIKCLLVARILRRKAALS